LGTLPLSLLLLSCARCGGPEIETLADFGPSTRTTEKGADFFGINEAVAIPFAHLKQGLIDPSEEGAELIADARLSRELGATIVRGNSPVYPYLDHLSLRKRGWDWTRSDLWVQSVQQAGLEALLVLGPWPGNRTGAFTSSYLPADLEAYDTYIRRVVERYDGDGVDDMPGLERAIRYWEVDNEPDLHNSVPARGSTNPPDPETFETPEEYAQILIRSARVIRETHPDPVILSGGLYRPHHERGRAYLESVLAVEGAKESIDVLSLHCYFDKDSLEMVNRTMLNAHELLPGVPVWITETGVPSIGGAHVDEEWQGRMVAGVYGAFLAAGADRIFWHTLADPPDARSHMRRSTFASHSLLQTLSDQEPGPGMERMDKSAGRVFRRLAELMAEVDPASLAEIEVGGGRILETDQGWLAFWGSPELPAGAGSLISLDTGEQLEALASPRAPFWIHRAHSEQ
jgi:hypothetical protein